jgi:translation initiation factor IF-1
MSTNRWTSEVLRILDGDIVVISLTEFKLNLGSEGRAR